MIFEEKTSLDRYYRTLLYENIQTLSHCQRSFEILFVLEGSVEAEKQGAALTLTAGQALWVMPYEVHRYATPEHSKVCVVIFSEDTLPDFAALMQDHFLLVPVLPFAPEEPEKLMTENSASFAVKAYLYGCCSRLVQGGLRVSPTHMLSDPMTKVMLYLQEHMTEELTLHDLAEKLGYSYHYTSALFRKMFHTGFAEYRAAMRLDQAARLLRNTDMSIGDILEACGFEVIRSFDHAFRKQYGESPSAYRKRMNSQADKKQAGCD